MKRLPIFASRLGLRCWYTKPMKREAWRGVLERREGFVIDANDNKMQLETLEIIKKYLIYEYIIVGGKDVSVV